MSRSGARWEVSVEGEDNWTALVGSDIAHSSLQALELAEAVKWGLENYERLNKMITDGVANYRFHSEALKKKPGHRPFEQLLARSNGWLDLLMELHPTAPAWRDTKWVH